MSILDRREAKQDVPEYKIHAPPNGKTQDVVIRVSAISNGFMIKAGGAPYFCETEEQLSDAVRKVVTAYTNDVNMTAISKVLKTPKRKPNGNP